MTDLATAHQYFQQGDLNGTVQALQQIAPGDRDLEWHSLKAVTHALRGEFEQAERILQDQLSQHPDNLALRINLGNVQMDQGQVEAALATFAYATRMHPDSSAAWHNLGIAQMAGRQWDAAAQSLYSAAKRDPSQPVIRLHAALALARGGHTEPARAALSSLGENPDLDPADELLRGNTLMALRDNAAALEAFARVLDAQPGHPEALINSATLKEQANAPDEAAALLDKLPEGLRSVAPAALVRSRLLQRENQLQAALDALPQTGITDPDLAVEIMFQRARLLDAMGEHAAAYAAARTANSGARQLRSGPGDTFDTLLRQAVSRKDTENWAPSPVAEASHPVFVVGLPRSGSTLLDVMLDSHPQLQVLGEAPCLERLVSAAEECTGHPYPAALNHLTAEQIQQLQLQYFDDANRALAGRRPQTRLIDKNPLNVLRLPLIQRIFAGAPVILTTRDSHDAAVSCFLNDLGGRGQQGFWSLRESRDILQELLRFAEEQSRTLGISPWRLRYEQLVASPRQQMEMLCNQLDIPFDPAMLDTGAAARARGAIGTPSYAEVTRPVHTGQVGRARHYAAFFEQEGDPLS